VSKTLCHHKDLSEYQIEDVEDHHVFVAVAVTAAAAVAADDDDDDDLACWCWCTAIGR
jgi:hypothetical protein